MEDFTLISRSSPIITRRPVPLPTAADILAATARLSAPEKVPTRPTLPYYAPRESLPARLPTVEEILATPPEPWGTGLGRHTYPVNEHFMVKYGSCSSTDTDSGICFQEGENMLFVQQSTNIPIPKLYAMFHDEKTGLNFIIQEFIPGNCLQMVWDKLDGAQKKAIASQMRRNMDELRRIPSPGYYGTLWRQPIRETLFTAERYSQRPHPDKAISGPHETEYQWTEAMLRYLDTDIVRSHPPDRPALERAYRTVFNNHSGSVFTHSHLYHCHLILREDGTVVIVNWENAGWYPTYWEYCCSYIGGRTYDWAWLVHEMLDVNIAERELMKYNMNLIGP